MQSSPVHVVAVQAMFQRFVRDSTRHHRSCTRRVYTTRSHGTGRCSGSACVSSGAWLRRSHQCDHRSREVTIVDHLRVVVHNVGALSMRPRARVMQSGAVGVSYEQLVVA